MRIALPASIDPAAFAAIDPACPVVALGGETMGTTWRALVADPRPSPAGWERALAERLDLLVGEMSHWAPMSVLSRFNASPAGNWTVLPPDFARVMEAGLRIAASSDGAFDPTIGALVDLHGFGPPGPLPPPTDAALAAALAASGYRRLAFDPGTRRLRQPGGLRLDLSGIAKGYAADALAALLRERGVRSALVEVGGELVGYGVRPDGDPWWVDLEAPPFVRLPTLRVALHGLAVATSGSYVRGAHNIDPRTGRPADKGGIACNVIAGSAMEADAWASALTVLGVEDGLAMADALGLAARLVSGDGEHLSHGLRAMLEDDRVA